MAAGRPIGYLDLCAGIGGFACAMHRVAPEAARCVGYSEILPAALECYARNFPDAPVLGVQGRVPGGAVVLAHTQPTSHEATQLSNKEQCAVEQKAP